jgi:hypothetical protein
MKERCSIRRCWLFARAIVATTSLLAVAACNEPSEKVVAGAVATAFPAATEYCWLPSGIEEMLQAEEKSNSICVKTWSPPEATVRCVAALREAGLVVQPSAAFMKDIAEDAKNTDPREGRPEIYKARSERFATCAVGAGDGLKVKLSMKTFKQRPLIKCGSREAVVVRMEKEGNDRARVHYSLRVHKPEKQTAIDAACGEIPFDPAEEKDALLVKVNGTWSVAGGGAAASASGAPTSSGSLSPR